MSESDAFDNLKKEIRSILLAFQKGCSLSEFRKDYRNMIGRPLPFVDFNFHDDLQLLHAIPDTVKVVGHGNNCWLMAVADESTRHIQDMVARQKPGKKKQQQPPRYSGYSSNYKTRYSGSGQVPPRRSSAVGKTFPAAYSPTPSSSKSAPYASKPDPFVRLPASFVRKPASLVSQPASLVSQPAASASQSASFVKQPASFAKQPASVVSRLPTFVSQPAPVASQQATVASQQATVASQQATVASNPKPTSSVWGSSRHWRDEVPPRFHFTSSPKLLPPDVECRIVTLVRKFSTGLHIKDFFIAYQRFYNELFLFETHGFQSLMDCLETIRDLRIRMSNKSEWVVDYIGKNNMSMDSTQPATAAASAKMSSDAERRISKKADTLDTFELMDARTSRIGVSENIKKKLREIMSRNKQGIWAKDFPCTYEAVTGSTFDLHSLGFMDLACLVDEVPDVLRREQREGSRKDWLIMPAEEGKNSRGSLLIECSLRSIRKILEGCPEGIAVTEFLHVYSINCNEPLYIADLGFDCIENFLLSIADQVPLKIEYNEGRKTIFLAETEEVVIDSPVAMHNEHLQECIPYDAASPDCRYCAPVLPRDTCEYIPMYTSAISHPGFLFVQLQENSNSLGTLYDEIEMFYSGPYSDQYCMQRGHLKEDAMCAALWPQDQLWYRARIVALKPQDSVEVFYVDYGTIDVVPQSDVRYLKGAYSKLPAQALRARLAHLKPPNEAMRWSPECRKRMLELCHDVPLMASVDEIEDGILSLILCDTRGDRDLYINDILLQEGLAEAGNSVLPPAALDPIQIMQAQCYWQMYNTLSLTMTPDNVARAMADISLHYPNNPLVRPPSKPPSPADESEIFQDDDDLFEEFYQKASSVLKRYVKRIRTGDGYHFHLLIVDSEPQISSGDLSALIWSDKSHDHLLQRLQSRDMIFPSCCLSREGNEMMFQQFEKFHVKGVQKNSVIVHPLKSAIAILNTYGHPSAELRHKIVMEIDSFNPQLPAWQELSEAEIPGAEEEVFRAVTDDDKLNRLCIHDLKAMNTGIRRKRNELVRSLERQERGSSAVDELEKLERLLQRVVVRIERIQQICTTFS